MVKLVTLDISSNKTGAALFVDGELENHGVIDCHENKNSEKRMDDMSIKIMKTLNIWKPDIVYCEDTWTSVNPQASKMLTRILGVVYGWCLTNNVEYNIILPSAWRTQLGFKQGKAKRQELKKQSMEYVKNKYNLDVNDDEADAICIGCSVLKKYGR